MRSRGSGRRARYERPGDSDVSDWWTTAIIDMAPGQIRLRGHPIEELIGARLPADDLADDTRRHALEAQARLLEHARWWPRWITGRRRPPSPRRAWR
jgi:hypothetical protein